MTAPYLYILLIVLNINFFEQALGEFYNNLINKKNGFLVGNPKNPLLYRAKIERCGFSGSLRKRMDLAAFLPTFYLFSFRSFALC